MRKLLAFALMLTLVGVATAADLGNQAPVKSDPIVPENPVNPDRQGGDTIFDATVIPGIPYSDSGTTAGYIDDYDEACPYTGSTSADVVYSLTLGAAAAVDIDLCGSAYDTKLYVYDAGLSLVACNDDFYFGPPCGTYVSKLENVNLAAGVTYYIVIDGYGGSFGNYLLDIVGFEPCVIDCPAGGFPEGEPPIVNDYVDNYNGGCNSTPDVFQSLTADANGDLTLCGKTGIYSFFGLTYRDTDWFIALAGANGGCDILFDAEYALVFYEIVTGTNCAAPSIGVIANAGPCLEGATTLGGYAEGAAMVLWFGPSDFGTPPGEWDYVVWLSGLFSDVATENTSWSSMKALYQ
jgi:hypothetical protein